MLDLGGMHRHSPVVFWELFLSSKIAKTWIETADIWQVQYENETTKELLSYISCMHYKDDYITE